MQSKQIKMFETDKGAFSSLALDVVIASKSASPLLYAQTVRLLLQSWRQGTVACKSRGQVSFSTRKPWKQKGTGRARAGSLRSPIWRSGGVTFGPQPRVRSFAVNKRSKKLLLGSTLASFMDKEAIYCVDFSHKEGERVKTKEFNKLLHSMGLNGTKVKFFLPYGSVLVSAMNNLSKIEPVFFDQPNAYDLTNCDSWVFLKQDIELFKQMVAKWN